MNKEVGKRMIEWKERQNNRRMESYQKGHEQGSREENDRMEGKTE